MRRTSGIFLALFILLAAPAAYGADLMLGLTTWYTTWVTEVDTPGETGKTKSDYSLLYGPAAALSISDWTFSISFLYGTMDLSSTDQDRDNPNRYEHATTTFNRFESDVALSYRVFPWMRFFFGMKYYHTKSTEDQAFYTSGVLDETERDESIWRYYAPGAGVSFSIPITYVQGLYCSFNSSYSIIRGNIDETENRYNAGGVLQDSESNDWTVKGWSVNFAGSLSYYIQAANTAVILGYRYQYLDFELSTSQGNLNIVNKYYGVTLAAMYFIPL